MERERERERHQRVEARKALGPLGLLMILALTSGCASIVDGGPATVGINSNPSGATVRIQDKYGNTIITQQTPCTVCLKRGTGYFGKASYTVVVEKEGYAPFQTQVNGTLNAGWYLVGNFFIGGLIGWLVVDPLTGAMWDLEPLQINANLATQTSGVPTPPTAVNGPARAPDARMRPIMWTRLKAARQE